MSESQPPSEILDYYALGLERERLDQAYFPLERARTQELLLRHLPPAPAVVLDLGGGAGAYAFWLAARGYEVHLLDPVALHVRQAEEASRGGAAARPASVRLGDARALPFDDASAEAVLMLGPLYHLTERRDRLRALAEARRVLRQDGLLFAAAISRFTPLLDGLSGPLFDDPAFAAIVERDLRDGQHRNETGKLAYFTTAFFHRPDELASELGEAGFALAALYAIEGPGAWLPQFRRRWDDTADRERLLAFLRIVEREPALLGMSPHLLGVARRG